MQHNSCFFLFAGQLFMVTPSDDYACILMLDHQRQTCWYQRPGGLRHTCTNPDDECITGYRRLVLTEFSELLGGCAISALSIETRSMSPASHTLFQTSHDHIHANSFDCQHNQQANTNGTSKFAWAVSIMCPTPEFAAMVSESTDPMNTGVIATIWAPKNKVGTNWWTDHGDKVAVVDFS